MIIDKKIIQKIEKSKVFDLHTHLFPHEYSAYSKNGLVELLTYHYLTSEVLNIIGMEPSNFFNKDKFEQASIVWHELFQIRLPLSEAARGIISLLNGLEIHFDSETNFEKLFKLYEKKIKNFDIFSLSSVSSLVMTNNPFDLQEWELFDNDNWDRNKFRASLRIDDLFYKQEKSIKTICNLLNSDDIKKSIINFFDKISRLSKPAYCALSIDGKDINKLYSDNIFSNVIFPWLQKNSLPLMIMVGVERKLNPELLDGGDGYGEYGAGNLKKLFLKNKHNNFLLCHLSNVMTQELVVLSRVLKNVKLVGHWWYNNNPSFVKSQIEAMFELLGVGVAPQFSDSRVSEHLFYKWHHYKNQFLEILYSRDFMQKNSIEYQDQIIKFCQYHFYDKPISYVKKYSDWSD